MGKNRFISSLIVLVLIILGACHKGHELDCLKSAGKDVEEIRNPGSFFCFALYDDIDLVLATGPKQALRITGKKNILAGIRTEVEHEMLWIENENQCNWVRDSKNRTTVYLTVTKDQLKCLEFHGSGNITFSNALQTHSLNVDAYGATGSAAFWIEGYELNCRLRNGASDLTFQGMVQTTYAYAGGVGFVFLSGLQTSFIRAQAEGTGDIYVGPSKELMVDILHRGSIYYTGDPIITHFVDEGEGKLVHLQD